MFSQTAPDRSLESPRSFLRDIPGFVTDVEPAADGALPVGVSVTWGDGCLDVFVTDRHHALYRYGTSLGEADVTPEEWKRLVQKSGASL